MSNKDAAQARLNAKTALRIRAQLLENLESVIETSMVVIRSESASAEEKASARAKVMAHLNSDVNTMLRDAENRGLGAPKQEVALGPSGPVEEMDDDELEAIARGEIEEERDE